MSPEPWALSIDAGDAPVDVRERLRLELTALVEHHPWWAVLSTCHRVEVYGMGQPPHLESMREHQGEAAVRRLMRIAAGLESASLGEDEVLHQVRQTLAEVRRRRPPDHNLVRLLETAIACGRRVRARSRPHSPALAERALGWLAARSSITGRPLIVAGAGVMGESLARAAQAAGATVQVISRTPRGDVLSLAEGAALAPSAAGLAIALSGPWLELEGAGTLPPIADLSAPAAVPVAVREALGSNYLGVDDLFSRAAVDAAWVSGAESLVEEGVREYLDWHHGRLSVDTLKALRERVEGRREQRLERLLRRLPALSPRDRDLIEAFSRQVVTDLMHEPVSSLRRDRDGSAGRAARRLFDL
ncbi:MAG TPA: hypothetical protein VNI34_09805 [Candidatus Nitrosotalea sp.]|nr:hypothetical protein [Candidatus Nitrosotalea sp.]